MAAREAWESGNDLLRMESGRAVAGSIVIARARYATPRRGAGRRGHSLAGANISPSLSLPPVDVPPLIQSAQTVRSVVISNFVFLMVMSNKEQYR